MRDLIYKIQKQLLYVCVFLLPWHTIWIIREVFFGTEKWHYGTIGIYVFDCAFLLWIVLTIYLYLHQINIYITTHKKLIFSGILLSSWTFLSITWAQDHAIAFYGALTLSLAIDLFFLIQIVPINKTKIGLAFIISIFAQSIIAITQFLTQNTVAQKFLGIQYHDAWHGSSATITIHGERWLRAYSGMPHPNILGGFLLVSLLVSLWILTTTAKKTLLFRIFLFCNIAIVFSSIIFTFSRTTWLATIISISTYYTYLLVFTKKFPRTFIAPLILIGTLTVLFIYLVPQLFFARVHDTRMTHNSFGDRTTYIAHAHTLITHHPFRGVGISNYTNAVSDIFEHTHPIWYYQPVHNIYLLIYAEIGAIGFALFCFFFGMIFYDIFMHAKTISPHKFIFFIIVLTLLIIGLLDHWPWTSHSGIFLLFLFIGLAYKKNNPTIVELSAP